MQKNKWQQGKQSTQTYFIYKVFEYFFKRKEISTLKRKNSKINHNSALSSHVSSEEVRREPVPKSLWLN